MIPFLKRRLTLLLITAFILTIIAFVVDCIVSNNNDSAEQNNYVFQYINYLWHIFNGNFGYSSLDNKALLNRGLVFFASTLELCFVALIFSSLFAIPMGILAGLFRNSRLDYVDRKSVV